MAMSTCGRWTALACVVLVVGPTLGQVATQPVPDPVKDGDVKVGTLKDQAGDLLPEGARVRLGTSRFRGGEYIPASALSPDGKLLAIGSNRDMVHLMDPKSGKELRRLNLNGQGLTFLAFTPDSTKIACMGYGPGIRLFNADNGKLVWQLQNPQPNDGKAAINFRGTGFQFSTDGKIMAAGNEGSGQDKNFVFTWDLETGKQLHQYEVVQNYSIRVALTPDGKTLASWGHYNPRAGAVDNKNEPGRTIQLWNVQSGKEIKKLLLDRYPINAATFSPDGKTLAVSSGTATYHAFDVEKGKETRRYVGRRGQTFQLRYAPDGKALYAATMEGVVQVWEAETGKRLSLADGPVRAATHLAFPEKGPVLALSSMGPALHLWDAATGKSLIPDSGHHNRITAVCYTDKHLITAGADGKVCWWDPANGKEVRHLIARDDDTIRYGGGPRLVNFAVSPDGKYLAAGNDYGNSGIRLWELPSGKVLCDLEGPRNNSQVAPVFSPDGKYLAAGGFDSMVYIWEIETGRELPPIKFKDNKGNQFGSDQVRVAFAPDGKTIAISDRSFDRFNGQPTSDLSLWEIAKGKQTGETLKIAMGQSGPVYSADGKLLAVPTNRTVLVLRADNGKEVRALDVGNTYYNLLSVAFAPDGRTLAVAAQGGGYRGESYDVFVWELASGHQRQILRGHQGPVISLAFSPDGRTLATGSADTTTLLWDLTGQVLGAIKSPPMKDEDKEKTWNDLAAARGEHFQLYRKLLATPAETLSLIKENLKPAQGVKVDPTQVDKLIAELDDEQFSVRVKATRALEQLGDLAGPALIKARETFDKLEPRRRIDTLLDKLERTNLSAEELRGIRAVELLELIGTPEARDLLGSLAEGSAHSRVTQDARRALGRVKGKS